MKSFALTTKSLFVSFNSDLTKLRSLAFSCALENTLLMLNFLPCSTKSLLRPALCVLFAFGLLSISACSTHKKVEVPQLLTPLVEANTGQLHAEINRLASVKSIHGKVDLQFEDNSFAEAGVADKYRSADGTVTIQRPGKVYLVIQVPVVATPVAQMTSDGEHFRIAILQGEEKYRRFVKGTNNAVYAKLDGDGSDPKKKQRRGEKETVSALSNLRPQHFTDALMIRDTQTGNEGFIYSQSEFFQEESDTRPGAKKSSRVVRGYYLLEELSLNSSRQAHLHRRFWFDRVGSIRLARLQTFDDHGLMVTDVAYDNDKLFGENAQIRLPTHVVLTRPQDRYTVSITYQAPESVIIDREYKPEAFVLENKWQLPEVDLDTHKDTPTSNP